MGNKSTYKWCIFYINSKFVDTIKKNLIEEGYDDIKCCVPSVSVLKKRSKGKDIYEDVPILFNYGFIRIPTRKAYSRAFLNKLKRDINGIHSWVKSPETMHSKKLRKRTDNAEDFDDFSIVATVSRQTITRLKRLAKENLIHINDEIANLTIGSYITLTGYPFDGVPANVLNVSLSRKEVELLLYPENGKMVVKLPLDNVAYTVYRDHDPDKLHYAHNEDMVGELNYTEQDNSVFV